MALIPPFFVDSVVAIGFETPEGKHRYAATGFLYGKFLFERDGVRTFKIFLVTNRHVFEGKREAWLRFNPEAEGDAEEFKLLLKDSADKPMWLAHADAEVDLAVVGINVGMLREKSIRVSYFDSDRHVLNRARAVELGVSEGDGIYVLGFPMGMIGAKRNFVVVRQGSIARIRDALHGTAKEFLVDATVFPGNSGGPVITRPEFTSIQGTPPMTAAYLIGVVSSYVPYPDVAVSEQTGRPRVVFEENSGLAAVVPADFLFQIIDAAEAQASPPADVKKADEESPRTETRIRS